MSMQLNGPSGPFFSDMNVSLVHAVLSKKPVQNIVDKKREGMFLARRDDLIIF